MHSHATLYKDEITVHDLSGGTESFLDEQGTDQGLLMEDPLQLRMEAELFFYEFLHVSGVVADEADYQANFRDIFALLMRGKIKVLKNLCRTDARFQQQLQNLHQAIINDPIPQRLYIHCQNKIMAYLFRIGKLPQPADYVELGYHEIFQLLSTGAFSMRANPDSPKLTAFPDHTVGSDTVVPPYIFGTRTKIAQVVC